MNAVIHRDYFEEGARVMVEIYDDRVEISYPGELLFDKKDLGRRSVARNPVIFDVFHRLGLIEKVGSGIGRILNQTHERGVEVDFDLNRFFTIIIRRPVQNKESKIELLTLIDETQKAAAPFVCDLVENSKIKLTEREIKNLLICAEMPRSSNEILSVLDYKTKSGTLKRSLRKLIELGILEWTIPEKPKSSSQKYKTVEEIKRIIQNRHRND